MPMSFFSPLHIIVLLVAAGFLWGLYALFRNADGVTKRNLIISLMGLNLFQHFFKHLLYPHLWGTGFGLENTVYNFCASLIIFSPVFHFGKSGSARQFIAYLGTIAGSVALLVPYQFFGKTISTSYLILEFIRFYICHLLLIASSLLPVLWKRVRFRHTDFWKFGLYFIGLLCTILLNNVIVLLATGEGTENLYEALLRHNAIALMGPPHDNTPFEFVITISEHLTIPCFLGGDGKPYTPILWYAIPLWFGISVIAFLLGMIFDRKNFFDSFKPLGAKRPLREVLPTGRTRRHPLRKDRQ